jgi:hypothetical protein
MDIEYSRQKKALKKACVSPEYIRDEKPKTALKKHGTDAAVYRNNLHAFSFTVIHQTWTMDIIEYG